MISEEDRLDWLENHGFRVEESAMPCPTCDHTMHALGCKVTDRPFFWCPRCGTVKPCDGVAVAPVLPERCRAFAADPLLPLLAVSGEIGKLWHRLGIEESIWLSVKQAGQCSDAEIHEALSFGKTADQHLRS